MIEADILAETYKDKVNVGRYVKIKKPNGATTTEFRELYSNLSCALSKNQEGIISEQTAGNSVSYNRKLFARPDADIVLGDELTVTCFNGKTAAFISGEPMYYESHIEVPVTRKVVA